MVSQDKRTLCGCKGRGGEIRLLQETSQTEILGKYGILLSIWKERVKVSGVLNHDLNDTMTTSSTPPPPPLKSSPDRKLVVFPGKPGKDCWCSESETLTGMCSRGLASAALMLYPSRGTCSILPLWANSRCVPGGTGRTSGRGVGPTGAGVTACSIPAQESRVQAQR